MNSISEKEMQKLLREHPNMKKCAKRIGTCNACGPCPATCMYAVDSYSADHANGPIYCLKAD